jgi:hypothetical protein
MYVQQLLQNIFETIIIQHYQSLKGSKGSRDDDDSDEVLQPQSYPLTLKILTITP